MKRVDFDGAKIERNTKESGKGLLEMIAALGIMSFVLMLIVIFVRQSSVSGARLRSDVQILESLMEAEDFLRKEFQSLQFVPYCAGMLPPYDDMRLGEGIDENYRHYLQESVRILKSRKEVKESVVDLRNLKGSGSATYTPPARKNIAGILLGTDVLQMVGLLPTALQFHGDFVSGYLTADLVGVRRLIFYATDCRASMVFHGRREGDVFVVQASDEEILTRHFDPSRLHLYVVKEYLIYVKVEDQKPYFMVDFLDGQAFLRIANIADLRVDINPGGILSVGLIAASVSDRQGHDQVFKQETYSRIFKNAGTIRYRKLLLGLE